MKDWNMVLTSHMHQERRLLTELADRGEFRATGFTAVLVGKVPETEAFLEYLRERWERQAYFPTMLSSAIPVRVVFSFTREDLAARITQEAIPWLAEIGDAPFYVRLKRRGHKGVIASQEVEQAVDRTLLAEAERRGQSCRVDFREAQFVVVVELIHNQGGVGLISRQMRDRYPFIKLN